MKATVTKLLTGVLLMALVFFAESVFAAGGAYSINFAAARPTTYLKLTPIGTPCAAVSGVASNPIVNADFGDKVESLEPQDLWLGQIVAYELKITVNGDTAPENGMIDIVAGWNTETTSGSQFGYDESYGVYCAFIDDADSSHADGGSQAKVLSYSWTWEDNAGQTAGPDEIVGTFHLAGLESGDTVVLEIWMVLDDAIPTKATGNIQSRLVSARTTTWGDVISTGNQTVPLLQVGKFDSPSDYGDAPDSYGTTLLSDGPRHAVVPGGPRLGAYVDTETDGAPSVQADGDDNAGLDDEDGLLNISNLVAGSTASMIVEGTAGGMLDAWLDFNGDGDFADSGEQITTNLALTGSAQAVTFAVPIGADFSQPPYLRLRVSSAGSLSWLGAADDGEVEDYQLTASIGDYVWEEIDKDGIQEAGELGIPNVRVDLYSVGSGYLTNDYTDASGKYGFSGLTPGDYYVKFHLPANYSFSPKDAGANDAIDSDADTTSGITATTTLSVGENDTSWDAGMWFEPTLVVLTDFGAIERGGQVVVYWETSSELGTIGFFLERLEPASGEYVQVNETIIPGSLFSDENNAYEVVDASIVAAGSYTYRLIEIENTGLRNTYGPFEVAFASAATTEETEVAGTETGTTSASGPALTAMTVGKGHMVLRWASTAGATYRIERAASLGSEFEVVAEGIAATVPENTAALIDGAASGFYRVITE